jgi:hypothetical protein
MTIYSNNLFPDFLRSILGITETDGFELMDSKTINRSLTLYETELLCLINRQLTDRKDAVMLSNALIYGNPECKREYIVKPEELKFLEGEFSADVEQINAFLPQEEALAIMDDKFTIGERAGVVLGEFERAMISMVSVLVQKRVTQ